MFFFLFGYGPRRKDLGPDLGPDVERDCPNCHNCRRWYRYEEAKWVTVFFMPVIRTGRKRFRACPICHFAQEE